MTSPVRMAPRMYRRGTKPDAARRLGGIATLWFSAHLSVAR